MLKHLKRLVAGRGTKADQPDVVQQALKARADRLKKAVPVEPAKKK